MTKPEWVLMGLIFTVIAQCVIIAGITLFGMLYSLWNLII